MKIKVTADSTCDLSKELLNRYDITTVPLYVLKDGKAFRDGADITPEDILRHVEAGGELCTTSAVTIGDYQSFFGSFSAACDAVIHICIGSGFSCCYQNACIAAREYPNVYVIDSRNLSTGQGLLTVEAALLAASELDARNICETLRELSGRIETSFLINRLDYLRKGGRCSLIASLGANILQLKPCIEVVDGRMQVAKKYRGSFEHCLAAYVKDRLRGRADLAADRIFITHTEVSSQALREAREGIGRCADFREVLETRAGCTIFCHCGPGTLGILFIREKTKA